MVTSGHANQHVKSKRKQFFADQKYFELANQSSSLLAYLIHQNNSSPAIVRIQGAEGTIHTSTQEILDCFTKFYADLYTSRIQYSSDQIDTYLSELIFPTLTEEQREQLDRDITLEELENALKDMAKGKASGPDGLPLEVYAQYQGHILPALLKVYHTSHAEGTLPDSFSEATIIVLLKPDKNPVECGSYRPISLLNMDYKLLTKILATRLRDIIPHLIHPDQSGFIKGRSTSNNLRRVQIISQEGLRDDKDWALVSLDAAKAFDSIEWPFLTQVLCKFNFGPKFLKWIAMLYNSPRAAVALNGRVSSSFNLSRGT